MTQNAIENTHWSIYINGWYQHKQVQFLPNGKIQSEGTEGFANWLYTDNFLLIADELGKVSYKLVYVKEANIWFNNHNYRKSNNNLILAPIVNNAQLKAMFDDEHCVHIANKSAAYKGGGADVWGHLFFGLDGKIYNYHNTNESFWQIQDGKLQILNDQSELMMVSVGSWENNPHFVVLKDVATEHRHYLSFREQGFDELKEPAQYIKFDVSFGNQNDTLLVIFNSAGGEYSGFGVKYEFYHLPFDYPVDYIRVAQSAPSRWYLNDLGKIEALIKHKSYKKIICIGMSMGAYAALWINEMLANTDKQTQFYTIAIQTLSSLDKTFLNALKQHSSDEYRSKTPTYDIVNQYLNEGLELDIANFLKQGKDNVTHYVIYDGLNNAEDFSQSRLVSERVRILTMPYETQHSDGCYQIYHSNIVQKLMDKMVLGI